jgi:hypothetical protein
MLWGPFVGDLVAISMWVFGRNRLGLFKFDLSRNPRVFVVTG